jgi:predicted nicotinamide N-methyase
MTTSNEIRELSEKLSLDLIEICEPAGNSQLSLSTLRDLDATIDRMFEELTRLQKPELLDQLCPYFGVIWPAARALAEVIDYALIPGLKQTVDTRIIELGCGLAIPSLVAAQKGAQVFATDFHPQVERFLKLNREKNCASSLRYVEWDWRTLPELPPSLQPVWGKAEWVIASDVLYDRDLPVPLARAMAQAVTTKGRITLTDPGRPYLQLFCDELTKNEGFRMTTTVVRVKHPRKDNPAHTQEIFVLDFRR